MSLGNDGDNHTTTPLRICIATAGRFHVLDLARELLALGHDVTFFSYVPASRLERFGYPKSRARGLLKYVFPLVFMERYLPNFLPDLRGQHLHKSMDALVKKKLEPCDIFIGMSGMFVQSSKLAKEKYGANIVVVRGSKHVREQASIVARGGGKPVSKTALEREEATYETADMIDIPARHVAESFRSYPGLKENVVVNPYGVNLDDFPLHAQNAPMEVLKLICVGDWCFRKGCDVLQELISSRDDVVLHHFGRITDLKFPVSDARFVHHDPVDQKELTHAYKNADALVLASREEGLALVQAQALASGLPVLCTHDTGGADLAHTECLGARIISVPSGSVSALEGGLEQLISLLKTEGGERAPTKIDRETLSWRAYAKRYEGNLFDLLQKTSHGDET